MSVRNTLFGGASLATGIAVSVLAAAAPLPAAAAQTHFNCQASAVRLNLPLGQVVNPVVANPANNPCREDSQSLLSFGNDLGIGTGLLTATTNDQLTDSNAKVSRLELTNLLNLVNLTAKTVRSNAQVAVSPDGTCRLHAGSALVSTVVQGKQYNVLKTPVDIDVKLLGLVVAKLHLNATLGGKHPTMGQPDPTKITQRAVWLEVTDPVLKLTLADLIVGEASVERVGACRH